MDLYKPIPVSPTRRGWELIDINECGEELVSLNKIANDKIQVEPRYYLDGHKGARKEIYVRKSLCQMLNKATESLPEGYKFLVWDAWRPVEVQISLFEMTFKNFRKDIERWGHMNDEELKDYIGNNCVTFPSSDPTWPSPHSTGGSIDLTIIDSSFQPIATGTNFDDFSENVATRYYEEKLEKGEKLDCQEKEYLKNRRFLYNIMINAGLTNYSDEWWHYDYGNQFWGKITSNNAIYGKASLK